MKNSINLVLKRRPPGRFHKRFLVGSVIFFSFIFLVSAGFILYRFFLVNQLNALKQEQQKLITRVNADPEKKVKFLTIRERLSEVQKILKSRKNINAKIESISDALPVDVGVSRIDGDEEKIVIKVSASSLSSLNSLIEERISEYASEGNRGIKRVEMRSFGLNPNSLQYEATFSIEYT